MIMNVDFGDGVKMENVVGLISEAGSLAVKKFL